MLALAFQGCSKNYLSETDFPSMEGTLLLIFHSVALRILFCASFFCVIKARMFGTRYVFSEKWSFSPKGTSYFYPIYFRKICLYMIYRNLKNFHYSIFKYSNRLTFQSDFRRFTKSMQMLDLLVISLLSFSRQV